VIYGVHNDRNCYKIDSKIMKATKVKKKGKSSNTKGSNINDNGGWEFNTS